DHPTSPAGLRRRRLGRCVGSLALPPAAGRATRRGRQDDPRRPGRRWASGARAGRHARRIPHRDRAATDAAKTNEITAFAPLLAERYVADLHGNPISAVAVLGLTSRPVERADPTQIAAALPEHWSIENGLHYVRDVTFAEDTSRIRIRSGPRIMTSLRIL